MNKKKIISLGISILMIVMLIPSLAMGNENIEKEIDPVTENLETLTGTEKILYKTEFQGNTYEFVSGANSWEEAKIVAEEAGGHLVTITSLEEQEFLNKIVLDNELNEAAYYIGLFQEENSENWQWVTDEKIEYINWNEDQQIEINDQLKVGKMSGKVEDIGKWYPVENKVNLNMNGLIIEKVIRNDQVLDEREDIGEEELDIYEMSMGEFEQKLARCRVEFPHNAVRKHYPMGQDCHGYARLLTEKIFGIECMNGSAPGWVKYSATSSNSCIEQVSIGDLVRYRSGNTWDHTIIVTNIIGDTIFYTDCNSDNRSTIKWDQFISKGALAAKLVQPLHDNPGRGWIAHYAANPVVKYEPKPFRSNLEYPGQGQGMYDPLFTIAGWALHENGVSKMTYTINNGPEKVLNRVERSDVNAAFPEYKNNLEGFYQLISVKELTNMGENTVIVQAHTTDGVLEIGRSTVIRYAEMNPPTISDVAVTDVSSAGYTVTCKVSDESGIEKVQFPTWTDHNGQDDLVEDWNINPRVTGTINGDTVTFRVNDADHNYEEGFYNTHIYAFDIYGNMNSGYGAGYKMENKGEAVAKASYNNHEYLLIDDTMTWNDALVKSTELGGHLVTITDEKEQEIVNSLIESGKRNFYWIGGNDIGSEGQWRWSTGEPFSYSNWASGEPNNCEGDENILGVYKGGGWNDLPGRDLGGGFILEKEPIVEDITETVTYGKNKYQRFDIALSWEEAKSYCENLGGRLVVSKSEEQNEVIRKLIENGTKGSYWLGATLIGSNWCGTDGRTLGYSSWGEGQPDNDAGIEHYLSMNKDGRWNDLPKAFYDMGRMGFVCEFENSMLPVTKTEFGNSTYEFYKNTASWKEANRIAKESGGHLVTITSEEEQNFIKETIKNNQIADRNYYIGATDEEEEGNWKWVTGEPMKYTHWMPNEPNNVGGKQHYGVLDVFYNENYLWDDGFISFGNGSEVGFIVEKDNLQLGDVDGSGKIEAYDALLALQIATQKRTGTAKEIKAANVDGNPGVQAFDALRILQFATGKITGFLKN